MRNLIDLTATQHHELCRDILTDKNRCNYYGTIVLVNIVYLEFQPKINFAACMKQGFNFK